MAEVDKDYQHGGGGAADIRIFFKAVFQLVMLFGVETWVVTPRMGQVLGGFQDQVARRSKGRLLRRQNNGKWENTSKAAAREEEGFKAMEEYIKSW